MLVCVVFAYVELAMGSAGREISKEEGNNPLSAFFYSDFEKQRFIKLIKKNIGWERGMPMNCLLSSSNRRLSDFQMVRG